MILTTFPSALQRSAVLGLAAGSTSALAASLATNGWVGAAVGSGTALAAGSLSLYKSWEGRGKNADRLRRLVKGASKPRIIARNRPDAPHSAFETIPFRGKDVRIHYFEAGQEHRSSGTLVLVHGFGSHAYQWNRVFDEIADRHHVIGIDLFGHGYSSCLPGHDYDFVEVLPVLLNDFLDRKGLRDVTLVGSSLGGGISQIWASGNERIRQLILFGSSGCTGQIENVALFVGAAIFAGRLKTSATPFFIEKLGAFLTLGFYVHPTSETFSSHDVEEFARPYHVDPQKVYARADFARQIRNLSVAVETQTEILRLQAAIKQPVLIVYSEADRAVPLSVPRAQSRLIENSRVLYVPKDQVPTAGHTLMSDTPRLALRIIEDVMEGRLDLSSKTQGKHLSVQAGAGLIPYKFVPH